jgi:fucose permease
MSKQKYLLLFIILFIAMFLFGFIENVKGVTYPLIKLNFDVSYEAQGMMVSVLSLSYVLFCIVGGILIGSWGVKKTFALGSALMILGLAGAFFLPGFLSVTVALFVVSAAFGIFEVCSNALATQIFITRTALFFSLMHFFYGAGSSLSPLAAGCVAAAMDWRRIYLFLIPLTLVFFIPSVFALFPKTEGQEQAGMKKASFFTALGTPMVWVFAAALGLMAGVEICSPNWAGLYFQDVYNLSAETRGAVFVSHFYIFFTVSRLLSGFIIEKIGYMRCLFIATFAAILIFVVGFILGANGIYVLPALGFFVAIFWPALLATAMVYFRQDSAVMTSAIIVIAGLINSLIQFAIGLANRFVGPAWGYRSALLYAVLIIAALLVLTRLQKKPYAPSGAPSGGSAGAGE